MRELRFENLSKSEQEVYVYVALDGYLLPLEGGGFKSKRHQNALKKLLLKGFIADVTNNEGYANEKYSTLIDGRWYCSTEKGDKVWFKFVVSSGGSDRFTYMETHFSKLYWRQIESLLLAIIKNKKYSQIVTEDFFGALLREDVKGVTVTLTPEFKVKGGAS